MKTPREIREAVLRAVRARVVGQEEVLDRLLVALLAGGHVLLEGVPGLAKTLMARSLAAAVDVSFRRIQFTPDLLPADVLGGLVYRRSTETFAVSRGPIFANMVLADELNRAPPRVQSALLEAMEEEQVTLGGHTLSLPDPFLVVATQNPLEQQGTYPLAEAQADRFLFRLQVDYPTDDEESALMDRALDGPAAPVEAVVGGEDILAARDAVTRVHVDREVRRYLTRLVRASRTPPVLASGSSPVEAGISPRGGVLLGRAARAWAALQGRDHVLPRDVQELAPDVFRHRLLLTVDAEVEGWNPDRVTRALLDSVPLP